MGKTFTARRFIFVNGIRKHNQVGSILPLHKCALIYICIASAKSHRIAVQPVRQEWLNRSRPNFIYGAGLRFKCCTALMVWLLLRPLALPYPEMSINSTKRALRVGASHSLRLLLAQDLHPVVLDILASACWMPPMLTQISIRHAGYKYVRPAVPSLQSGLQERTLTQ